MLANLRKALRSGIGSSLLVVGIESRGVGLVSLIGHLDGAEILVGLVLGGGVRQDVGGLGLGRDFLLGSSVGHVHGLLRLEAILKVSLDSLGALGSVGILGIDSNGTQGTSNVNNGVHDRSGAGLEVGHGGHHDKGGGEDEEEPGDSGKGNVGLGDLTGGAPVLEERAAAPVSEVAVLRASLASGGDERGEPENVEQEFAHHSSQAVGVLGVSCGDEHDVEDPDEGENANGDSVGVSAPVASVDEGHGGDGQTPREQREAGLDVSDEHRVSGDCLLVDLHGRGGVDTCAVGRERFIATAGNSLYIKMGE